MMPPVEVPDQLAYLSIRQAMAVYGGSRGWFKKAIYLRQIPYFKRGSSVVFSRIDLDAYFASRRVTARTKQEAA